MGLLEPESLRARNRFYAFTPARGRPDVQPRPAHPRPGPHPDAEAADDELGPRERRLERPRALPRRLLRFQGDPAGSLQALGTLPRLRHPLRERQEDPEDAARHPPGRAGRGAPSGTPGSAGPASWPGAASRTSSAASDTRPRPSIRPAPRPPTIRRGAEAASAAAEAAGEAEAAGGPDEAGGRPPCGGLPRGRRRLPSRGSCGRPSEEARIRELLEESAARAEKRDVGGLMDLFAPDYEDFEGRDKAGHGPARHGLPGPVPRRRHPCPRRPSRGDRRRTAGPRSSARWPSRTARPRSCASSSGSAANTTGSGSTSGRTRRGSGASPTRSGRPIGLTDLFPESLDILRKLFPDL